ncbi:hypothetical protein SODG_003375 [Sodalis praecaptivus]
MKDWTGKVGHVIFVPKYNEGKGTMACGRDSKRREAAYFILIISAYGVESVNFFV